MRRELINMRRFGARPCQLAGFAALLIAGVHSASAQEVHFTNYRPDDGLPQTQVLAIHQDRLGFLWIGTYGGLTRFDGVAFRTFTRSDGLSSNTVTAITEDAAGRIVVGLNGSVCVRLAERFRCVGGESGLLGQSIAGLVPDSVGGVWVASDAGVVHVDSAGSIRAVPIPGGGPAVALARDQQGSIWVATATGIARLNGATFVAVAVPTLRGERVRVMRAIRDGLLMVTQTMIVTHSHGAARVWHGMPAEFAATITDAVVDRDDVLWIATRRGARFQRGVEMERLTRDNGLIGDDINTLATDREGNIWFGTESGLSRLTPGPFRHYTERAGLPSPFVRALSEDGQGQLWVGTRNGVAVRQGDQFRELPEFRDSRVYAFAQLPGRGMLVATRNGLLQYDLGLRRRYDVGDGLPDAFVRSLLPDPGGGVWVGTRSGMVRWERGRIVAVADTLLARASVTTMMYDAGGRLWVGLNIGGVFIHDKSGTRHIGAAAGLSDQSVWDFALDADGRVWVGTNGDGAYRVSPSGTIERFGAAQGLRNQFVWQVLVDRGGRVWFYTNRGIDRLANGRMQHLERADGLRDLEGAAGAVLEDRQEMLWFGTGSGLTRYRIDDDHNSAGGVRPEVTIEGLLAGAQAVGLTRARIPSSARTLRISYTSPVFRTSASVRFRHRMIGEADWSEPTADRSITIVGLAPGEHTFEISADDGDGRTSQTPARLVVTVLPAFWQTVWFRLLMLLSLGGMVVAVPVLRARRIEAERDRLEREVSARTAELADQARQLRREVAEREAAEAGLRRSEERLRDIVEHSTNMFYSHTPDHVLTYVSPQSQSLLGLSPEEMMQRFDDIPTGDPANAAGRAATQRAIDTREKQPPYELELRHASGHSVWVVVNEAPIVHDGRTVAIVGSLTNITAEKLAHANEVRLAEQLRQAQKMEAIGRLAGGIAHDFNNLLTTVVGSAELLMPTVEPETEAQKDVEEILRSAGRATTLVAQLMAFSRQQLVKRDILDVNVVIMEATRMLQRVIGENVTLVITPPEDPAWVLADQGQLDQVLVNLTTNARDAMPNGGAVEIEARHEWRTEALAPDVPPGRFVVIRLSDHGTGMDAATVTRLFEPFFTTKSVGQGTGLGLAMVYGIVKQNGGHIEVESVLGHGTTFRVYLPASDPPTVRPKLIAVGQLPAEGSGEQVILVVEDEPSVRTLVCRSLRRCGYRVLDAPDGPAAIAIAAGFPAPIHLLLSDVIMPGMHGGQVAEQITAARPDTKVLFMTGYSQGMLGGRGIVGEATQVIQKPFRPVDLVMRVKEVLSQA